MYADPVPKGDIEQMKVNESVENYLEAILVLSRTRPVVRSVDVANKIGFNKSSVCTAMKKMRQKALITVTEEGFIYLTDDGREIAETIHERHEVIYALLIRLGVDNEIAAADACRMEHCISRESLEALKKYI
jgi:Mn-dependent DtxR family transcriptional regulator